MGGCDTDGSLILLQSGNSTGLMAALIILLDSINTKIPADRADKQL